MVVLAVRLDAPVAPSHQAYLRRIGIFHESSEFLETPQMVLVLSGLAHSELSGVVDLTLLTSGFYRFGCGPSYVYM